MDTRSGKLHRKAEIERNQGTKGQIDAEVLLHEQDREPRNVCRGQNKEHFKRRAEKSKSGQKSEVSLGQLKSETHDEVNQSPGQLGPVTLQGTWVRGWCQTR